MGPLCFLNNETCVVDGLCAIEYIECLTLAARSQSPSFPIMSVHHWVHYPPSWSDPFQQYAHHRGASPQI